MEKLISVPVVTYNSAEFIIETLESIFNQTYKTLELIVSDDCSTDNTVQIIQKWCSQERVLNRFVKVQVITVPKNTGIPANFNRCVRACNGEWLKFIAGDDLLMPNCVLDNITHVLKDPTINVLYSYLRIYKNTFTEDNFIKRSPGTFPTHIISPSITAEEQYQLLLAGDKIPFTPGMFLNRQAILKAGLPKEHLFSEDYQTKLNLTRSGFKLNFLEKETVCYRQHDYAINNTVKEYVLKPHYFKTENFRRELVYPNIPNDIKLRHQFNWVVNQVFRFECLNLKSWYSSYLHYILTCILNPFNYVVYIKSTFISKYKDNVFYKK